MASKITHTREWQLAIGSLYRVDSFPNQKGGEQIILTFSMDKNSVTQFATVTCNDLGYNAWKIVYIGLEELTACRMMEMGAGMGTEETSSYLKKALKKCLKTKMNILLQKDQNHWKTVGVGKVGNLDSSWIFFDGQQNHQEKMMAQIREEYLRMIPNLNSNTKESKIRKI